MQGTCLRFEHIELPAKLLDYFLRSNKSNINQSLFYTLLAVSEYHVVVVFSRCEVKVVQI